MTAIARATAPGLAARTTELFGLLRLIASEHAPAALASSLGAEDMVLTDAILRARLPVEIFTLDTGRLHSETIELIARVEQRYRYPIRVLRPDPAAVAIYAQEHGLDAIYESVELRLRCCEIRKVEPLKRALAGKAGWITGLRREQATTRRELPDREYDAQHRLWKFSPLAAWSERDVWDYLHEYEVPYNPLHDQGFRSIGCAPCTRPTAQGEDVRAGRWWWESAESKECGLHKRVPPVVVIEARADR
jgi:phosphoadenosine phosphosulfate reductase